MSKDTPAWKPLVDAAVERLSVSRRTFTEEEAMREVWEAGYEVSPQDDQRFVLAAEADGKHPHHWRLSTQTLANNRLLDVLRSGTWDGRELDQELDRMDARDDAHYVFCPVDARFTQLRDGSYALADGEPDITLPAEIKETLDALGSALLARWREAGAMPWTTRVLTETVAALGWAAATEGSSWLLAAPLACCHSRRPGLLDDDGHVAAGSGTDTTECASHPNARASSVRCACCECGPPGLQRAHRNAARRSRLGAIG